MSGQDGFVEAAFSTAEPVISPDIQQDPRIDQGSVLWAGLGSVVGVPLVASGKSIGVLVLGRTAGRTPFTDTDAGPLLGFADRPLWRWNWPSGAGTPSRSRCCRTATGSPAISTTSRSSGCSRPG